MRAEHSATRRGPRGGRGAPHLALPGVSAPPTDRRPPRPPALAITSPSPAGYGGGACHDACLQAMERMAVDGPDSGDEAGGGGGGGGGPHASAGYGGHGGGYGAAECGDVFTEIVSDDRNLCVELHPAKALIVEHPGGGDWARLGWGGGVGEPPPGSRRGSPSPLSSPAAPRAPAVPLPAT